MEEHPLTPILIISKIRYAGANPGSSAYKLLMQNRDFQENLVKEKKENGDDNIYFLDGSSIPGADYFECTVDGSHPDDLGSYRIAEALIESIVEILPN